MCISCVLIDTYVALDGVEMHQDNIKKGVLTILEEIFDENGICIKTNERKIKKPKKVKILDNKTNFLKIRERLINSVEAKDIGLIIILANKRINFDNGLLRIGGKGITPKPIKTIKQISEILSIHRKTAESLMKRLLKGLVILQINNLYYINPSFLQYGGFIEIDIFLEMIKIDPKLLKHIDRSQAKIISYFR